MLEFVKEHVFETILFFTFLFSTVCHFIMKRYTIQNPSRNIKICTRNSETL